MSNVDVDTRPDVLSLPVAPDLYAQLKEQERIRIQTGYYIQHPGPDPDGLTTAERHEKFFREHPQYQRVGRDYVQQTVIPFGPERTVEMMLAELRERDDMAVHTRGTVATDSPFKPAGAKREDPVITTHVIGVGWHWNDANGCHDGYALYVAGGGAALVFPEHEYEIVDALATPLPEGKAVKATVNWLVKHSKSQGIIEIVEDRSMTEQQAEATTERWVTNEVQVKGFMRASKVKVKNAGVSVSKLTASILTALHVEKIEDFEGSELEANALVDKFCTNLKEAVQQQAAQKAEQKQDETPKHWKHDPVKNGRFWKRVGNRFNKYQFSTKAEDREAYVHDVLGVEHIDETPLEDIEAAELVEMALDNDFASQQPPADEAAQLDADVKEVWTVILPDVKAITNGMITDKGAAITYALDLLEAEQMMPLVKELGKAGVLQRWEEKKKYAHQPPAQKTTENKPQGKQAGQNGSKPSQPPAKPQQRPAQPIGDPFESGDPFVDADEVDPKLRLALSGPAGSGKSYTALKIATSLIPGGKIAVLDSERGSAAKYRKNFNFKVLTLESYDPAYYIAAIHAAERNGYDVLIIDSLSHAWEGKGGILEQHEDAIRRAKDKGYKENSYTAWREVTPLHNELVDAMLNAKLHIIVTLRAKTEYVQNNGKVEKVGMAPIQRPGLEYEFDIVGDLDQANNLMISKTRCSALNRGVFNQAGKEVADKIRDWLDIAA